MTPFYEIQYYGHYEASRIKHQIPEGTGEVVLQSADAHYYDNDSGHRIAVKRMYVLGAERDVALAYDVEGDSRIFVTVFPLKEGQQRNRQRNGRWEPYEPESEL